MNFSGGIRASSRRVRRGIGYASVPPGFLLAGCCLLLLSIALVHPCKAEMFADTVLTPTWTWDFAKNNCACEPCSLGCFPGDQTPRDFELGYIFDPPIGWALGTPYGGQPLGWIPIDSVRVAPTTGYGYLIDANDNEELTVGKTYVLRTMGGGHALLSPLSISFANGMTFIYKYQSDGSGIFIPDTAIYRKTWGGIKRTYSGVNRRSPE